MAVTFETGIIQKFDDGSRLITYADGTTSARDTGGEITIRRPDGQNPVELPDLSNLGSGIAKSLTGVADIGSMMKVGENALGAATNAISSLIKTFDADKPAGGPPYENVLEQFASYSPLWTLACLTPGQFNNPYLYRGNPAALQNVVFSSAGRYGGKRVNILEGAPEYFVNNFSMRTQCAGAPSTGLSNMINISFEVYEPYSMGLFLQSLQAAAINAGYPSYNGTPYLLKLEFFGYRDDGSMFNPSELLTKYFVITFKDITFSTNEGGSTYKVEAVPGNSLGWVDSVQNMPIPINIAAKDGSVTVADLLAKGDNCLVAALNKHQEELVKGGQQQLADKFSVVFPVDFSDKVGLSDSLEFMNPDLAMFFADEGEDNESTEVEAPEMFKDEEFIGDGPIGYSDMGFSPTTGGNYNFNDAGDVVDPKTGVITRDLMTIDPKARTFSFQKGAKIQNVISQVVLSSMYAKDAIKAENIVGGFIKWFRVDVQVQLGELDFKRGERSKKYIYRVMPYYVHHSVFKNPTAKADDTKLKEIIAKEYNYIYTGKNNDVLKFDIQINNMFKQGMLPMDPSKSESEVNTDGNAPSDEAGNKSSTGAGGDAGQLTGTNNASAVPDPKAGKSATKGGYGAKSVEELVVAQMYNAVLNNGKRVGGDLVQIQLEILGDPYWISDAGLGNYVGDSYGDPMDQITPDLSMNYQGADTYLKIIFRTPVEPNLGVDGQGGLYKFQYGGLESPFSGVYKVLYCTSKFQDGHFKQVLECNRMPFEEDGRKIDILNSMLTRADIPDTPKDSPNGYEEDPWGDLALADVGEGPTDEEIAQNNADLGDFMG